MTESSANRTSNRTCPNVPTVCRAWIVAVTITVQLKFGLCELLATKPKLETPVMPVMPVAPPLLLLMIVCVAAFSET